MGPVDWGGHAWQAAAAARFAHIPPHPTSDSVKVGTTADYTNAILFYVYSLPSGSHTLETLVRSTAIVQYSPCVYQLLWAWITRTKNPAPSRCIHVDQSPIDRRLCWSRPPRTFFALSLSFSIMLCVCHDNRVVYGREYIYLTAFAQLIGLYSQENRRIDTFKENRNSIAQ
jgi:hypothetical protein